MCRLLSFALISGLFFSCGGSLQDTSSTFATVNYNPIDRSYLVFDPFSKEADSPVGVPFPNDLLWADSGGFVKVKTDGVEDPAKRAFYEAVNSLNIKGLSPNTPIFIPLSRNNPIDLSSLAGKFFLVDLTNLQALSGRSLPVSLAELILHTSRLEVAQDGRYLKFYPVRPLEAGHKYLFILLSGFKDAEGNEVLPAQIYNQLESKEPLSDPKLGELREVYRQELYDKLFPLLSQLLGVELNEETVAEAFTFTTADKTLSIGDFGAIEAYLKGEAPSLEISGLPYSSLNLDFGALLQPLSDEDFVGFLKNLALQYSQAFGKPVFPAVSIKKLQELGALLKQIAEGEVDPADINWDEYIKFIPVFMGNKELYDGKVYIFQHGLGSTKERAQNLIDGIKLPVVAIDLPLHGDYTTLTGSQDVNPQCVAEIDGKEVATGKCFLTSDVISNRLNIYQAAFNLLLLEKLLRAGAYDLNGDGNPDVPAEVDFIGVSMGAITGELAYANSDLINRAVFSVGGGNYVSIIDSAKNELIEGLLSATGLKKNTNAYAVTLGLFQLILDPADPSYFPLSSDKAEKNLFQSACCDTVVPPVSNRSFAISLFGGTTSPVQLKTLEDFENPPVESGWYVYGDEEHWVIHSFLLHWNLESYPEVAPHTSPDYLEAATKGAQKQAYLFLTSE